MAETLFLKTYTFLFTVLHSSHLYLYLWKIVVVTFHFLEDFLTTWQKLKKKIYIYTAIFVTIFKMMLSLCFYYLCYFDFCVKIYNLIYTFCCSLRASIVEVSNFLYLNKSHMYTLLTYKFLIIVSNKH